jgi:pimeloyl-ACP methyl ester carboxylesterase
VLGIGMGAAAAIGEAAGDPRVTALILDSSHATLANALQARLERTGDRLGLPGAWAILLGGLLRTGEDLSAADPVQAMAAYGSRPVLLISGGRDDAIGSHDAQDLLAAAQGGGSDVTLEVCAGAGHGASISACPDDYAHWVLDFLTQAFATPS